MERRPNAAIGAITLSTEPRSESGHAIATMSLDPHGTTLTNKLTDPVVAARRWLDLPDRGGLLDPSLRDRALRAMDVAAVHMELLDGFAAQLATQLSETGAMDPELVAIADEHAETIEAFSLRLRMLLDPEAIAVDANDRLDRGLEAAIDGGLLALVDAL